MRAAVLAGVEEHQTGSDGPFFSAMALAALGVMFAGFAASYYLWPIVRATGYASGRPISPSFPLIVHVHAAGFSAWILLLAVQARLVAGGREAFHRRLGLLAMWLVPFLVVTGLMTAVRGARDGWNPGGPFTDALGFMIVPVGDIAVFTPLVIAGLALRRRPDIHKRLMLLATLGGLMPPAITRMPVAAGRPLVMLAIFAILVLAPAVRDFRHGSRHRWLSLGLGVGILGSVLLRPLIGSSAAWRSVAAWVVS